MTDLITQLCQLTAEIIRDNPQGDMAELIARVKTKKTHILLFSWSVPRGVVLVLISADLSDKVVFSNMSLIKG